MRARTPMNRDEVKLSVLIPVYNERDTIDLIVDMVHATPIKKEIICVNDKSTDGTAIRQALAMSTGDIVIVQDADLEYDPGDWPVLLEPILDGKADACFGSRFLSGPHRVLYYWHSVGNRLL